MNLCFHSSNSCFCRVHFDLISQAVEDVAEEVMGVVEEDMEAEEDMVEAVETVIKVSLNTLGAVILRFSSLSLSQCDQINGRWL
jgi:hypothetical protein